MRLLDVAHVLAVLATLCTAAPAVADAWNEIDLATLPDKPDPSGRPGWYYPPDLPTMAQGPPRRSSCRRGCS